MINALVGLEYTVKEGGYGLVIGDVRGVKGGSGRLWWKGRVQVDRPFVPAFLA